MTPNKAIEIIDRLKPNAYSEEDKLRWIDELDGMVQKLVFQNDMEEYKQTGLIFKASTISKEGAKFPFKEGDAVTITGCSEGGNNKEAEIIIRNATPDVLTFDDNAFTETTENGVVTIRRKVKQYSYPDDMDKELLIPAPYENLYTLYIEAKIDYYNHEYANYNNAAMMFEGQFGEYKKAYIREHRAKG